MLIEKRNGKKVPFNAKKIRRAIEKANEEMLNEEDRLSKELIDYIIGGIIANNIYKVEDIQDYIEQKMIALNKGHLAKAYIVYRYTRGLIRKANSTDESILGLIEQSNKAIMEENSNKNAYIASTQRDLMAGEVSKDLSKRLLLPEHIVKAHEEGILHFHDMDYFVQTIFNCCLVNIKDMLDNGTVMNGKLIESPKSFQVACTVMTQYIAAVASNQYGGQSVAIKHLGKYAYISEQKYLKIEREKLSAVYDVLAKNIGKDAVEEMIRKNARKSLLKEIKAGVQTIQYQINTLMTTNGQSPFVTLFMQLDDNDEYVDYVSLIIEEILKQRIEGIKNEQGVYITPAFPKLIYVLDENNCLKGGRFDYITKLAVKCSSKRMYPDYISAKKMRENYEGEVFSCMGCRSFLSPWKDENGHYKWEGRFNQGVVSINLPQIGLIANGNPEKFWVLLDERLELCREALMCRHNRLKGTPSGVSPIHFQFGAIARLGKDETIDKLLMDGYSTISLGYIGLYELTKLMTGTSHTASQEFAFKVMNYMRDKCDEWKNETGISFGLYGTPAESLCYRFAEIDKEKFGEVKDVTDKGYYTNSYHVDVREPIDAFSKLKFESQFQTISSGGAISYIEIPNMRHNLAALEDVVKFIYDNIQYAEFNTKSDYCHECGYDGEIQIKDGKTWICPQCGNTDKGKMNVSRRTCGYLGENFWNVGKTKEIAQRVTHL